jgi:hypothetical protein
MNSTATNQQIAWFYQRYKEESLELSPDFQRNPVWEAHHKNYLIETLLLALPIPEIYVVNRVSLEGDSKWIVVDGQQRLRTILEFVTGELSVQIGIGSYQHIKCFSDLSEPDTKKFWSYPIVMRNLEDSSDEKVRDLFQRLNKYSLSLTDQELRHARFKGHYLDAVNQLGSREFWTTSGIFSPNDIRRKKDLEYIGTLLSNMIGGIYHRTERLDEFYTMYEHEFKDKQTYVDRFFNNLEIIDAVLPNIKKTRWKNKADFYTLFLLIDDNQEQWISPKNMIELSNQLDNFSKSIDKAKEKPEKNNEVFLQYHNAANSGTTDKEKRVRRLKILKDYLLK